MYEHYRRQVDNALAKAEISAEAYKMVLKEQLSLSEAKKRDSVYGESKEQTRMGISDPAGSGLRIGDEVYIKATAEIIGGPENALLLRPKAAENKEVDPKHLIYAHKLDFTQYGAAEDPDKDFETSGEIAEKTPGNKKIKQTIEKQYRELLQHNVRASSEGTREGNETATQMAMSELQKLSTSLQLGINFKTLDAEAHR